MVKRDTPQSSARVRRFVAQRGLKPQEADGQVYAYANHGRWVADCPCGGAELVTEGQTMLCGSCADVREVVWPENAEVIETILSDRPRPNQNWYPGEPVEGLALENERHK